MFVVDWSKSSKFLKICKGGTLGTFSKISKNMQRGDPLEKFFFDFFLNSFFHSGRSYETIRMPFQGVRMLETPYSTKCYPFASVFCISSDLKSSYNVFLQLEINIISLSIYNQFGNTLVETKHILLGVMWTLINYTHNLLVVSHFTVCCCIAECKQFQTYSVKAF